MSKFEVSLLETLSKLNLSFDPIEKIVQQMLNDEIYYFPIRHHMVSAAYHLKKCIEKRHPKIIFIELPADLTQLIPFLLDSQTDLPVSFYTSFRDESNILNRKTSESSPIEVTGKYQAWYPLVSYSPEYIAIAEGHRQGATIVFIDLPFPNLLLARDQNIRSTTNSSFNKDEFFIDSLFVETFSQVLGYKDFNESWDSFFEIPTRDQSIEEYRRNISYFCSGIRTLLSRQELDKNAVLVREAFMKNMILDKLQELHIRPSESLVVCGGLHAVVLHQTEPKKQEIIKKGVYNSLTPFSYLQISQHAGYGSGNRNPQYYKRIWEKINQKENKKPYENTARNIIVETIRRSRAKKETISLSDSISSFQTTTLLAKIRGRTEPILEDITDSLIICCVKGSPEVEGRRILDSLREVTIGEKVGFVTPKLGKLPLAEDFYKTLKQFNIPILDSNYDVTVNLKETKEMKLSYFLHRVRFCRLKYAKCFREMDFLSDFSDFFTEDWSLRWTPEVDTILIELTIYGSTVYNAALSLLEEKLKEKSTSIGAVALFLLESLKMDFSSEIFRLEKVAQFAIEHDESFISLVDGLSYLVLFYKYLSFKGVNAKEFLPLIDVCFHRACNKLPNIVAVSSNRSSEVLNAISNLVNTLLSLSINTDKGTFELDKTHFEKLAQSAIQIAINHLFKGALTGGLFEIRSIQEEDVINFVLSYPKGRKEDSLKIGEFLEGLFSITNVSLLFSDNLFNAVDFAFQTPDWNDFLKILPSLRRGLKRLPKNQFSHILNKIAVKYGIKKSVKSPKLIFSRSPQTKRFFIEIDQETHEILKEWNLGNV